MNFNLIVDNIKRIAKSKNVTQEQLAEATGRNTAAFYRTMKTGKLLLEHILDIAERLEVHPSEFFNNPYDQSDQSNPGVVTDPNNYYKLKNEELLLENEYLSKMIDKKNEIIKALESDK